MAFGTSRQLEPNQVTQGYRICMTYFMTAIRRCGHSVEFFILATAVLGGCGLQVPEELQGTQNLLSATLFASPNGSGAACSSSAPCSLAGAQQKVRTLNSNM